MAIAARRLLMALLMNLAICVESKNDGNLRLLLVADAWNRERGKLRLPMNLAEMLASLLVLTVFTKLPWREEWYSAENVAAPVSKTSGDSRGSW